MRASQHIDSWPELSVKIIGGQKNTSLIVEVTTGIKIQSKKTRQDLDFKFLIEQFHDLIVALLLRIVKRRAAPTITRIGSCAWENLVGRK